MSTDNSRSILKGRGVPVPGDDIDTDRIIPARFMKSISFAELGAHAFHDERFDDEGGPREHPFNDPRYAGASILIANRNFGCGSSREHAPQALMRWGIRAVIGESFAEIFSGNCTAMGIPAVRVAHDHAQRLIQRIQRHPECDLHIDLQARTVRVSGGGLDEETLPFDMPAGDRQGLISGDWDTTGVLLANLEAIRRTAVGLPYMGGFARG